MAEAAADAMKTGMDNECADFFTVAPVTQIIFLISML
jgi:hypothetical protein